ncbi:MAG: beta-1,6-N-acetylglucosaminyltransferase [Clostridiales bacterium]|nr:beta-1,6-N-acetylglucosaminyltransferase [Clostridiales bacterium]
MGQQSNHPDKHAYLIIAHKDDYTFRTLLRLLDDERNDLFIHMDMKNKAYRPIETNNLVKFSKVYHTSERINVQWGGFSQIRAELLILHEAVSHGPYRYYHLLSGQDLPIKSQDHIHDFFEHNAGKEFICFESDVFSHQRRVDKYHFFQETLGSEWRLSTSPVYMLNRILLKIQSLSGVKRNKSIDFKKGPNWFSITDDLANFILGKEDWVQKTFKFTNCADEVFLQTIVHDSDYANHLYYPKYDNDYHAIMRLIKWEGIRLHPHIWRITDKRELQGSDLLFARKFDCEVDKEIIDFVSGQLCAQALPN